MFTLMASLAPSSTCAATAFFHGRGAEIGPIELAKSRIGDGYGAFVGKCGEGDVLFTIPKSAHRNRMRRFGSG